MELKLKTFKEHEVTMTVSDAICLVGLAKFALEHLTDDFEDEAECKLMKREIETVNELDKILV
jgi:hypothetical protein